MQVELARDALEAARAGVLEGKDAPSADELAMGMQRAAEQRYLPSLRPVINATGVVLHTNLGRAPLCQAAMEAMQAVSAGYSNLEFDLETGTRGSRYSHLASALVALTGAEDALAVNNNAAAILLALSTLAAGKEVIVSRGEAVEIGGGFRIPDVLAQSGARSGGGWHHEPHVRGRLCARHHTGYGGYPAGALEQLPGGGFYPCRGLRRYWWQRPANTRSP